jgi:hypothetical protein
MKKSKVAVLNMMSGEVIMHIDVFRAGMIVRVLCKKQTALVVSIKRGTAKRDRETLE